MQPVEPTQIPEGIIYDSLTGYAVNIPLGNQGFRSYIEMPDYILERITQLRNEYGIAIQDFPQGQELL